jgi:hypothetical protein
MHNSAYTCPPPAPQRSTTAVIVSLADYLRAGTPGSVGRVVKGSQGSRIWSDLTGLPAYLVTSFVSVQICVRVSDYPQGRSPPIFAAMTPLKSLEISPGRQVGCAVQIASSGEPAASRRYSRRMRVQTFHHTVPNGRAVKPQPILSNHQLIYPAQAP